MISDVFGHRTFTHSLLFLLIIYFLATTYIPNDSLSIGLLVGMTSHLILDAGTVNGIKFLFPASIKVRLPFYVKTGGTGEQVVLGALTVVTCYYIAVICGISIPIQF